MSCPSQPSSAFFEEQDTSLLHKNVWQLEQRYGIGRTSPKFGNGAYSTGHPHLHCRHMIRLQAIRGHQDLLHLNTQLISGMRDQVLKVLQVRFI